jgi:Sulfotransferase family
MDREPIFVGGLDRSGKTLMRLSLSSHPNLAMTRRTYMWTHFYNRYGDMSRPDNFERCLAAMLRHKPMQHLSPDPDRIRREFWQGEPTYARLFALFHEHNAERLGKPRWGDQLGSIERYADLVFAAYPAAKMIHMIRDPRDRYEASVTPSLHRRGKAGQATARWLCSVALAARNQQRYPDRYKIVCYETFVSQREETLQAVCTFLGEEFVPGMLRLEDALRFRDEEDRGSDGDPDFGTSTATITEGPCKVMSKREIAFMQTFAKRDMAAYGYRLEPIRFSLRDRLLLYLVDWPANLAGMIAWRALEAKQLAP